MGYNGSVTANCWKVHCCFNCSAVFRYFLSRKVTSTGNTEEQASANLGKAALAAMQNGVDTHPCPTCGLVQPEMVGASRASTYGCLTWLAAALVACLAIAMGVQFPISTITILGTILAAALAGIFLLTAMQNPNSNLPANLRKAQLEIQKQSLFLEGELENPPPPKTHLAGLTDGRHNGAMLMLCVALLLMALPEGMRHARGWSENDSWFPAVIGPGDTSTYYFHRGLSSIKGYWKGDVKAELSSAGLGQSETLTATTQDNSWGDSISAKSSEQDDSVNLWAKVSLPGKPGLEGKEAKIDLKVGYVAPCKSGDKQFREVTGEVHETPLVHLATAGAGSIYGQAGWLAICGGGALLMLAGILLGRQAGNLKGNPHQALQAEE